MGESSFMEWWCGTRWRTNAKFGLVHECISRVILYGGYKATNIFLVVG